MFVFQVTRVSSGEKSKIFGIFPVRRRRRHHRRQCRTGCAAQQPQPAPDGCAGTVTAVTAAVTAVTPQADAPDHSKIPGKDLLGATVVLISCSYHGQEFIRVSRTQDLFIPTETNLF